MKQFFLFLMISLFISCAGKKEDDVKENVLPKEKFISLLIDMYMLEGKYSHQALMDQASYEKGVDDYMQLFKKHGTDKETVDNTFTHYAQDTVVMNEIFTVVLDSLNLRSNPKK